MADEKFTQAEYVGHIDAAIAAYGATGDYDDPVAMAYGMRDAAAEIGPEAMEDFDAAWAASGHPIPEE